MIDAMTATLVVFILLFNVSANILIKKGALSSYNIFINYYTLSGYIFFVLVLIASIQLITLIELKYYSLLLAANYMNTYIAGVLFFKEGATRLRYLGILCVCVGLVVFNL